MKKSTVIIAVLILLMIIIIPLIKIDEPKDVTQESTNSISTPSRPSDAIIGKEINDLYESYDELEGQYSEDKYTDKIYKQIMYKYSLTWSEVDEIWLKY